MKACKLCSLEKPRDEYYPAKGTADGLEYNCIPCKKKIMARIYAKEKVLRLKRISMRDAARKLGYEPSE